MIGQYNQSNSDEERFNPEEERADVEPDAASDDSQPYDDDQSDPENQQLTPQQFEANEERKLYLRRLLVIGVVIFLAIFYFVWANFLNFGYLQVVANAPFSVTIIGEVSQTCTSSPCEIKLKRGEKLIALSKSGFRAESIEKEIILWTTAVIKPVFKLEPHIKEVAEIPEGKVTPQEVKYKFIYDQSHNNYAVVKSGDNANFAISYFGGKLQSPFIIGSESAVLAIENVDKGKAFYINTITKERNSLKKIFVEAARGIPSPNGRYFLIENSGKALFVADQKEFSTIRVSAKFENAYWTLKNTLVLAYLEKEEDEEGVITEKYIFDEYDPVKKEQHTLFTSDSMLGDLTPKNIKVNAGTNTIFFESGEKKFEIVF